MTQSFGRGRFEVLRTLGSGGVGDVFEALDREQGVRVAIKRFRDFGPQALMQLKAEFRSLRDLHHPNLVSLGELIIEDGVGFFSMELVPGTDFLGYVRPHDEVPRPEDAETAPTTPDGPTMELRPSEAGSRTRDAMEEPAVQGSLSLAPREPLLALDERRLRSALLQLTDALMTLHAAGMVHRDVKPPNIRVTPEGRLVLLDFGLVSRPRDCPPEASPEAKLETIFGTPLYMAPEQIQGAAVGPPADWYAVGMILFHALLGKKPLSGSVKAIFLRKLRAELPAPSELLTGVPPDLDTLCGELLRRDPGGRPTGPQVLARLGGGLPSALPTGPSAGAVPPFVGRALELGLLKLALEEVREGRPVSIVLQGTSGFGKTALAQAFLDGLGSAPAPFILRGRCHERESIPYKALDGVVDGIVEALAGAPSGVAAQLLPPNAGLLVQAFPVLGRLEAFAEAASQPRAVMAPGEQRRQVFGGLRSVLRGLTALRPVVLFLDDMQWADGDSLAALRAIFLPPGAPPLLVLATARGKDDRPWAPPLPYGLEALGSDVRHVKVGPLSSERTLELVRQLLPAGSELPGHRAAEIAAESGGHPLFVQELLLHLGSPGAAGSGAFHLDDALWARISQLPPAPRSLLALVAVGGRPLANEVLAEAAALDGETYAQAVLDLRQGKLVRALGLKRKDTLEHFHDRIREAVLGRLTPAYRTDAHLRLAQALERYASDDAESLAIHWQGAGSLSVASGYAGRAAEQADAAFAFERAARLRGLALELAADAPAPEKLELQRKLAEALARAGKNAEAADSYLEAAQGASPLQAISLRGLAAERYLLAGYLDQGMPQMKAVVLAVHVPWRVGSYPTLLALLGIRTRLKLRGYGYHLRAEQDVPPELLLKVDTLGACTASLSFIDLMAGSYYAAQYLLYALEAGEPSRLSRAFALEFLAYASLYPEGTARQQALVQEAESLTDKAGNPLAGRAFILQQRAVVACTRDGALEDTVRFATEGEQLLRQAGPVAAWELSALLQFANLARLYQGAWAETKTRALAGLAEAEDRGDSFGIACATSAGLNLIWLMEDDPDEALRRIELASARYPRDRMYLVHILELVARTNLELYLGNPRAAHALVSGSWASIEKTFALKVPMLAYVLWEMRGRIALGMAAQCDGPERRVLLKLARGFAAEVAQSRFDWGRASAVVLLATVAKLEGRHREAVGMLARVEPRMEAAGARMLLWVVQMGRGALMGNPEGEALRASAAEKFKREGVRSPEKMTAIFSPGLAAT